MKKALIGIVVVVAVLILGGSWLTGSIAHQRIGTLTDHLTKQSNGMLRVVERNSNRGIFTTVEDVKFSFVNPITRAMMGGMPDGAPDPQFTIHNVIQHGPFPGFRTVGIARVESSIVMDESTSKMLISMIGTDKPVELFVTFGFTGDTRLDLVSKPIKVDMPNGEGTINWKGMDTYVKYSSDFKEFSGKASIPGLMIDSSTGEAVAITNFSVDTDFQTAFEDLFVGDGAVKIETLDFTGKGSQAPMRLKNAGYGIKFSQDKEYFNAGFKFGAGHVEATPEEVFKDVHFDFALNHLHGPTTAKLYKYFQEMQANQFQPKAAGQANLNTDPPDPAASSPLAGMDIQKVQDNVKTLLVHSPEFVVEHLGFATDAGDMKITGLLKLEGVTEAEINAGDPGVLMQKLVVTADVGIAKGLLEHWPVAAAKDFEGQVRELEKKGLLTTKGDRLESHIEFKAGKLTANGQPMM